MPWPSIDVTAITVFAWFDWLTNPASRTFWGFWLSSAALAVAWALLDWPRRSAYVRQWLSKDYWLHPSARQDYWLIALNTLLFTMLGISSLLWIIEVANLSYRGLNQLWPEAAHSGLNALPTPVLVMLYSLVLLLADDASRYALHRTLHSRWLWPIHRLHHSANILTPLTFLRLHPLEQGLYQLRGILVHGSLSGGYFFITSSAPQLWLIVGVSGVVWLFNLLGANLRHSNIPLHYGWVERILISPAQHQMHHGIGGSRVNYGSMLAIWDRCFGSWRSGQTQLDAPLPLPQQQVALSRQLLLIRPAAKQHHRNVTNIAVVANTPSEHTTSEYPTSEHAATETS